MQHIKIPKTNTSYSQYNTVPGSGCAYLIAEIVAQCQQEQNIIILTPDTATALNLEQEIAFFNASASVRLLPFPDRETLAYDFFSPHEDIISMRLKALNKLIGHGGNIVVVPVTTIAHYLCPQEFIHQHSLVLNCGDKLNIKNITKHLTKVGYCNVTTVMQHGEYTLRGNILDIFPMGSDTPYRIDLFDDEIDTIRSFEPESQRTVAKIKAISLLPAHEFSLSDAAIAYFRQSFREKFTSDPLNSNLYQDISAGIASSGAEYYLPLFFEKLVTFFDYLNDDSIIVTIDNIKAALDNFWHDANDRYEQYAYDITRPILKPNELFVATNAIFANIKKFRQIKITTSNTSDNYLQSISAMPIDNKVSKPLHEFIDFIKTSKARILFCAESQGRQEIIINLLAKAGEEFKKADNWQDFLASDARLAITTAAISSSFYASSLNVAIVSEDSIFSNRVAQRRQRKQSSATNPDTIIKDLAELQLNAPVVHIEHGVGRYIGLKTITVGDVPNEFLQIAYAKDANLYVPVSSLHLISRYSGTNVEHAPINHLGNAEWDKAKKKAQAKVTDIAAQLLQIHARRKARVGHAFKCSKADYEKFSNEFPFEETKDQETAIDSVYEDLINSQPMDRLVCGDVGFGKTEVAMRAAFISSAANKQVAVLVPTTLLAQQHYNTFIDRFADWPINIELISRFRTQKQQKEIIAKLQTGQIDIIIGTHKLLGAEIKFHDLGLFIIDEEHRFGVKQKERLKSLRSEVDILTLTATPIPRTLNFAMSGLRELSIISTPPRKRLAIKTFVQDKNNQTIKEAINREVMRGGQVYYLHNNVETIGATAHKLTELLPNIRIAIAHGQLRERDLENIMSDFYHQKYNVLVCTTIIETGIDIPSANTIIIDKADNFGLAQLHQLRGRVGRSHHQAYAYLFSKPKKLLSASAKKRLEAIASLEDLGAGFTLATHDLEIRGAGEILGEEQSGNMNTVGFSLYMEMLERAVKAMKNGEEIDFDKPYENNTEIDLKIPTIIPEDYIWDVNTRLLFYKKIANVDKVQELDDIQVEMIDRFGMLPQFLKNLFTQTALKIKAYNLGVKKITADTSSGKVTFTEEAKINPSNILQLINKQPKIYQLAGSYAVKFYYSCQSENDKFAFIEKLLEQVAV